MIWTTVIMALREIRRNTMRSALTTLGIVIGVGSVIAMVTLGRATSAKVAADIASMGANLLIVTPGAERHGPTSSVARALELADAEAIQNSVSAVAEVAPTASQGALIVFGNRNWSSGVTGTTNAYFIVRGLTLAEGEVFSDAQLSGATPVCILGETVRRELFGQQQAMGASIRVGNVSCQVIGVLAAKGQSTFGQDQDDFIVMPLRAFQRKMAGNADVGAIFISAASDNLTTKAVQQIELLLRERRRIGRGEVDDFSVRDMKEIAKTVGSVTGALTALLGAIAGVSLLVGGIGIMNIMLVSVTERTREIGLRLAIGARGAEVMLQFLIEAATLSTLGGALGVIFGLAMSLIATRVLHMAFVVSWDIVLIAVGFSATIGIGFGFFPARKAAHLNPIEALRHE